MTAICTDDHSSGLHCPVHGYDDSVPAPAGFTWHRVEQSDGQVYSALVPVVPIEIARAAWLRLMIPQLWAGGYHRMAAEYQVELDRLEAAQS